MATIQHTITSLGNDKVGFLEITGVYARGAIIKKAITVLALSVVVLVAFGTEAKAQIPKEGTYSVTDTLSGTYKALPMGKERVQITYEATGVSLSDTGEGPFHNMSFRCIGALHAVKGEYNDDSGFCVIILPDGDQYFITFKATGKLGGFGKGTSTIVGGTGNLVGIQGSSEFTRFSLRPAAEGTFQAYEKAKGQYKLP
jgi:hypothetical protein